MDLRRIEYFVAVVDHGSVTKAAAALFIAQPSLSQAIRALEREVGVELFDRSGRSLTLTPAGRTFEAGARAALREADRARERVDAVRDLRAGRLRVATTPLLALDPLPAAASRLRQRHPDIQFHVSQPGSAAAVVGEIRSGRAEIGLTHLEVPTGSLLVHPLPEQVFGLAVSADSAAGMPDPFPLTRLAEVPLVAEWGDSAGQTPESGVVDRYGGRVVMWSAHPQAMWELVRLGVGAAILPLHLDLGRARGRGVRVFETEPVLTRRVGVVHRNGPLSPAARAFTEILLPPPSSTSRPPGP
ncbi:LysR family transcriptional regulator [Mobilicoccus sp.]|uniref:LysR family transcriptional regulator n=1 Tax=Mobilicoccus sp. TaxID=2034349 RepID=UPI00289EC50A|nr:LysR family transcriptional regulator [Mobilicoccus sp.]